MFKINRIFLVFSFIATLAAATQGYSAEIKSIRLVGSQADPDIKVTSEKVFVPGIGEATIRREGPATAILVPLAMEKTADDNLTGGINEKLRRADHIEYRLTSDVVISEENSSKAGKPAITAPPIAPAQASANVPAKPALKSQPKAGPLGAVIPQSQKKKIAVPKPPVTER